MFMNGRGFKGYTSEMIHGRLAVKTQLLKGGFWWCSTQYKESRADFIIEVHNQILYVVTVGDNNFYEVGDADTKDLASVRCVKDDFRIIEKEEE
jgi:hypothetical protein